MVPSNLVALLVFLGAVAPGYLFVRIAETRRSRPTRSPLLETVEMLVIGALCTGVGVVGAAAAQRRWESTFIDVGRWIQDGSVALKSNPASTACSAAVVVVASAVIAAIAARAVHRGPRSIVPGGTVWDVLTTDPSQAAFISATLLNGSVVEGYAYAYPTGTSEIREFVLQAPVFFIENGQRHRLNDVDRTLIKMDQVRYLGLRYDQLGSGNDAKRRRKR